MIQTRLAAFRKVMKEQNIQCYIIPTGDYHNSEYVSEYFRVREYFSGFTGSAGTLVVWMDRAALFTDGRYFIQAQKQLQGSGITLMKMGEPGVPGIRAYVEQELAEGENIAFDGRVMTAVEGKAYEKIAEKKGGSVIWHLDPADQIWKERPVIRNTKAYILKEQYSGEDTACKLKRLREQMREADAQVHILTTLDDIAWLFNLRADDVESCPVLLAYALISAEKACLFVGESSIEDEVKSSFSEDKITFIPYRDFYSYVSKLVKEQPSLRFLVWEKRINYRLSKELEGTDVINQPNPTALMKAVKNPIEQDNIRKAHLLDGIAVTRFMYWLKSKAGKVPMTEISAAKHLEELRAKCPSYIEPSFATISAYGPNGAIVHYSAEEDHCAAIEAKGMLMVDSGGHYYEGSTDITRTFVLGEITEEMRHHFTLVARAMLRLMNVRFLKGCNGVNLDLAAREVFWEEGLDYKHGTGHGVGYLLNVHEGPNRFQFKPSVNDDEVWEFEEGMITTDEPGIYIEGSHGVRLENELLCRRGEKNEHGQFMYFENLTFVPLDLDGIDKNAMEEKERRMLNEYHRQVFQKLSPYFQGEELAWLRSATREI